MFEGRPPQPKGRFTFNEFADRKFCASCHTNVHLEQFRSSTTKMACSACHGTQDFARITGFDHEMTQFALTGKHLQVECKKCHTATSQVFPPPSKHKKSRILFPEIATRDCAACHKDPHVGKFGAKCSECHTDLSWKKTSDFHKNFTLSGVHYSADCAECHRDGGKLSGMSNQCLLCHQKDDVHNGTLPKCGTCHLQYFWESSRFKHSLTNFPLRGIHRSLDCYSCHSNGAYKGTAAQCVSCHLSDALSAVLPDHSPALILRGCNECHNQFSFR